MCLSDGYHGETIGALSVGTLDLYAKIYQPMLMDAIRIDAPDWDFSDADAGAPVDDAAREVVVTSAPFAPSVSSRVGACRGRGGPASQKGGQRAVDRKSVV